MDQPWLTPWWHDTLLAVGVVVGLAVAATTFVLVFVIRGHRRTCDRYMLAAENSLAMVQQYAHMFQESGSDLPENVKKTVENATREVINKIEESKSAPAP